METPLVSMIVPVYNVASYLSQCLESIMKQTYSNFELILVDDGSTDNSGNLCDEFRSRTSLQSIIVIHKENGGLSSARNAGLEKSSGEWVAFIDSDDYVSALFIECLLHAAIKNNCEIAKCNIGNIDEKTSEQVIRCTIMNTEEYLKVINTVNCGFSVCNKLFKRALFDGIRFPEGKLHEDAGTLYKLVDRAGKIVLIDENLYYVNKNPNSITNSKMHSGRLDDIEFRLEMIRYCLEKDWREAAKRNLDQVFGMINDASRLSRDMIIDYKVFRMRLRKEKAQFLLIVFFHRIYSFRELAFMTWRFIH